MKGSGEEVEQRGDWRVRSGRLCRPNNRVKPSRHSIEIQAFGQSDWQPSSATGIPRGHRSRDRFRRCKWDNVVRQSKHLQIHG